jgi:hypothetical protein
VDAGCPIKDYLAMKHKLGIQHSKVPAPTFAQNIKAASAADLRAISDLKKTSRSPLNRLTTLHLFVFKLWLTSQSTTGIADQFPIVLLLPNQIFNTCLEIASQ